MEQKELNKILESHKRWLQGEGGKRANLRRADLRGANLTEADLYRALLIEANLTEANLRGASLFGADLFKANLYGADLHKANLSGADFRGANLTEANLYGALLVETDLREADFANVKGLSVLCVQVNTSCENRKITYIPSLDVVTAGCFQGTFAEFEQRVEEEHKNNPFVLARYRRVIAFLKQEAEEDEKREKKK